MQARCALERAKNEEVTVGSSKFKVQGSKFQVVAKQVGRRRPD